MLHAYTMQPGVLAEQGKLSSHPVTVTAGKISTATCLWPMSRIKAVVAYHTMQLHRVTPCTRFQRSAKLVRFIIIRGTLHLGSLRRVMPVPSEVCRRWPLSEI